MKFNTILFSAFHKAYTQPKAEWIQPIQVGKAISDADLGYPGDDTGDNISALNPMFCELTMSYWIWKNADRSACNYWGLMHYRRYLTPPTLNDYIRIRKSQSIQSDELENYLGEKTKTRIDKDLQQYDVIMPYRRRLIGHDQNMTMEEQFSILHITEHWVATLQVIRERFPDYEQSFHIFQKDKRMYYANMMITSWAIWDNYLSWLFEILFEVNTRIIIPEDSYQKRVFGFLSERLLNLYVYHNHLKIKRYITLNIESY
ncbi:DUF4422 domain-containing protein [Paludibacter sp.]|uniref:DUF4422 domain-containing protein n=1 Tax=Paludibacter sp. TaxID=1898105 RepID=UPI0013540A61|nr:DUF4422 domain-containing protein [Paludibacter sp.]MTK52312.1 DUF4422 domain-containing protein [Paludibacter sp.]